MKTGRSLQELAVELDRQNKVKKDYIIDTTNLVIDPVNNGFQLTLQGDGQNILLGVNEVAHEQIASHTGIPARYYERMRQEAPELLATNVNSWFSKKPDVRMVRTLDGDARAFLSDRYRRIDNYEVAETVLPVLAEMEGVTIESCEVTDNRMYLKAVNPRLQKDVAVGDIVQNGILITNSEVGRGSLTIMPLVYRLVCSNGMVVNDGQRMRKYHVGRNGMYGVGEDYTIYSDETLLADDRALMLKIRDTVKAAVDESRFNRVVQMMKDARDAKITTKNVPKMIELVGSDFKFNQKEKEGILDHLIRDGEFSLYGLANAVTRTAQDVASYDRSTDMEGIGYTILGMSKASWNRLNRDDDAA